MRGLNLKLAGPGPAARVIALAEPRPYRFFIGAALALGVLPGFGLGLAMLLLLVGWLPRVDFWAALLQIHGHAQLWGFAGLFIVGVAYHVVPRFTARPVPSPREQYLTGGLLLGGVLARTVAQCVGAEQGLVGGLTLGAALELLAALHFAATLGRYLRPGWRNLDGFEPFLLAGLGWFVVASACNLVLALDADRAGAALLGGVAYEPSLHAALAGFVVSFGLGVTRRAVPLFLGLKPARPRIALAAPVFTLGVLATVIGLAADAAPLGWLGAALELGAAVYFVWSLRLFETSFAAQAGAAGREFEPYLRLAYLWLLGGLGLAAALAVREIVAGRAASGTELSSVRHALALGYLSTLIFGMALKIIPVFEGKPLWRPGLARPALLLFGGGALLRVGTELLAGYGTPLNALLGLSGVLGVAGFGLVALLIAGTLFVPVAAAAPSCAGDGACARQRPDVPTGEMTVAEAVALWPGALDVLVAHGFTPLRNPLLRQAMGSRMTLAGAASMRGLDLARLLDELQAATQ